MKRIYLIPILALQILPLQARQPEKGYRGFIEWSNDMRRPEYYYFGKETQIFSGISTSHGYQINPDLFVGAGVAIELHSNNGTQNWLVPLFAQIRTDRKWGDFTPFGDLRVGYSAVSGSDRGFFLSPSIGYRFNWGRKAGLNIGLGWTMKTYRDMQYSLVYDEVNNTPNFIENGKTNYTSNYLTLRIGFDF